MVIIQFWELAAITIDLVLNVMNVTFLVKLVQIMVPIVIKIEIYFNNY